MKKNVFTILGVFIFCLSLNAQSSVIKTSPGALAFGFFNACYEKSTGPKSSFEISGSFAYKVLGVEVTQFGLGVGYKLYVTKNDPLEGLYIMPNAGFSLGNTNADVSYNTIGFGALLGYQLVTGSGFTLDAGAGPAYTILGGDSDGAGFDSDGGIVPNIRLAIGYAW
jgi:hypothetical protein